MSQKPFTIGAFSAFDKVMQYDDLSAHQHAEQSCALRSAERACMGKPFRHLFR
jgi:hypothetical protein